MSITGCMLRVQSNQFHQVHDLVMSILLGSVELMYIQRLTDDVFNRHTRIQGRIGILEYHLHLLTKRMDVLIGYKFTIELELTAGRLVETKQGTANGRLTTSRLTNKTKGFTRFNVKGNAIDCLQGRG